MPKLEVFMSHLTIESRFADLLTERMTRDFIGLVNFFVSTDATSIPVGSQWFEELMAALQRAELLFVLCSSESVKRPWINYEMGGGRTRNIEVIPLFHSGMTPERLPVLLSMSEGAQLIDPKDLAKLYARIAKRLGSAVPCVDFEEMARQFQRLETEYAAQLRDDMAAGRQRSDESLIKDPRVVCVSSGQYLQLGFENQLEMVLEAFPKHLRHDRVTTSGELRRILMAGPVEIVHIAAFVCPRSGTLYFSPVRLPSGSAEPGTSDVMSVEEFATLLKGARTRLVVIASGDSLALATGLLSFTNVVAPRDIVSAKAMALWVQRFYAALRVKTLSEACELAEAASHASMRLLVQQMPVSPMQMSWQADDARSRDMLS